MNKSLKTSVYFVPFCFAFSFVFFTWVRSGASMNSINLYLDFVFVSENWLNIYEHIMVNPITKIIFEFTINSKFINFKFWLCLGRYLFFLKANEDWCNTCLMYNLIFNIGPQLYHFLFSWSFLQFHQKVKIRCPHQILMKKWNGKRKVP